MLLILFLSLFSSLLARSSSASTVVVDGVTQWKNPSVHVGDSIVFKHKYHYNLYIFQNQRAFNLCNFTQATLLTKNSTSYTWHPSRPGFYYFTFNDGSLKSCDQDYSLRLPIKVLSPELAPASAAAAPPLEAEIPPTGPPIPTPNAGGVVASSPTYPWPFRPREAASSPAPVPSGSTSASSPGTVPALVPDQSGGIPFINSNPAVPLPTGEADSATIRPFATSAAAHHQEVGMQVAARLLGAVHMALISGILLL